MTHSLAESLGGGSVTDWARDFLVAARFPVTPSNLNVVVSWCYAESGAGGGMWNPLNTTQGGYPGETNANSVGVKNYVRRADGIAANARVIHNGYYAQAVAWFQNGTNAPATVDAITRSPWGTRHIVLRGAGTPTPTPTPTPPKGKPMPCIIANGHGGYWIIRADGSVYAFGGATYHGGANGGLPVGVTITDAESSPDGNGYWMVSSAGQVYAFGSAVWHGNLPAG